MKRRGRLVALEGIDGAGKSTLIRSLSRSLARRGLRVARWKEPVDAELGSLAQRAGAADPWTAAVYFTLDRFLARPALEAQLDRCDVVLSDRTFYSTLAYQGSGMSARARQRLTALSLDASVVPDVVLLLELPAPEALRRVGRRGRPRAPLERQRLLERVARRYDALARQEGWVRLDAAQPPSTLARTALAALDRAGVGRRKGRT
jgi:dTMP kinase